VNNKELYDIEADPGETTNVIGKHPEAVAEMRAAYDAWWAETRPLMVNEEVPLALGRPFWVLYERQLNGQGIPKWEPPKLLWDRSR
jgi:arylsulfatase